MVCRVAEVLLGEETICAFCLITSAGVRMAQLTSSAREEAVEWIRGCGRVERGLWRSRRDLTPS